MKKQKLVKKDGIFVENTEPIEIENSEDNSIYQNFKKR